MAASDNLGPQFYHGTATRFRVGDVLTPEGANAHGRFESSEGDHRDKVYFSPQRRAAVNYAWRAAYNRPDGTTIPEGGHVYGVEPAGDYEEDPYSKGDFRTTGSLRVTHYVGDVGESGRLRKPPKGA